MAIDLSDAPVDAAAPRPLAQEALRARPTRSSTRSSSRRGPHPARRAGLAAGLDPDRRLPGARAGTSSPARSRPTPDRAGFNSAIRGSLVLMMIMIVVAIPIGFARGDVPREVRLDQPGPAHEPAHVRRRAPARDARPPGSAGCGCPARARRRARSSFVWARIGPAAQPGDRGQHLEPGRGALDHLRAARPRRSSSPSSGLQKSLLAGGLTLALLVLPIIIIASREAVRAVPVSIEQGAMALGATRWQAVSRQTFPAAHPGHAHRHDPRRCPGRSARRPR